MDARVRFERLVDEITDEEIKEYILDCFRAEKLAHGYCPKCAKTVQVSVPNLAERLKGFIAAIEATKGKPPERKEVTVRVTTLDELEALPDADLVELAAYREELPELPPAA